MNRKTLSRIMIFGTIIPLANFVSCANQETPSYLYLNSKNIVIASAIPKTWPQYSSIKNIIKDYNESQKQTPNFMPVKFMSKEETKAKSYQDLSSKINKLLATKSSDVPNLLVANFNQVYELSSYDKLINLTSNLVKPKLFDNKFVQGRTKLKRPNYQDGLWAVPFTVTTNSSLVFNKPVMKEIISLMQKRGMTINDDQENNPFIYSIMQSKKDFESYDKLVKTDFKKPSILWKDKLGTEELTLSDYSISDDTFKYFNTIYEFAKKAKTGLKLDQAPYIFGSYFSRDFLSILDSQAGASDNDFPLFKAKRNGNGYDFPFLNDSAKQTEVKEAFKEILDLITSGSANKPEDFNVAGLRNGQFAFSTMPSVASRYIYKSSFFGNYTNDGFGFEDFAFLPQPAKLKASNTEGSYSLAESMLMGIKTNEKKDKAVRAFIDFLFTGTMKENNEKVSDYLASSSGYVIPLKKNTSLEAIADYKKTYQDYLNNKDGKIDDNHKKAAIYRSIHNTFESINRGFYRNFDGDQYTSKLLLIIKNIFNEIVTDPTGWSADKFIAEIKNREREFNVYKNS